MSTADILVHNVSQLATCARGPRRGARMRDAGLIQDGAVAIRDGVIRAIGQSADLLGQFEAAETFDAQGMAACPGFVDPHTHVVYAGERLDEFEQRIAGRSYQEIMAAGGGILATTRATRSASVASLVSEARPRLAHMLSLGTTTAESKSGYGLELEAELRQLRAMCELDAAQPLEVVPTFLGAHALPPEYAGRGDDYIQHVIDDMLPAAGTWYEDSSFRARGTPLFVDVFCERGAFDVAQSRRVLEAARTLGLPLKAHVDEFSALGGLEMALELGATSVDHLDCTDTAGIERLAASGAIAVVIPTVTFNLGGTRYADARALIDRGAAVALSTDINPGSAPCPSMPMAMAIACRHQRLLPAEALIASTINAAHAVGLGARVGSLEPGKQADLLLLESADYRWLAYQFGANPVTRVMKRGTWVT